MTKYSKSIDECIIYHQGITFQVRGEKKKIRIQKGKKNMIAEC